MASNQLSKNIARCRKQIGMTQEDLGQALFISGQAVLAGNAAAPRTRNCCQKSQTHSASRSTCFLGGRLIGNPTQKPR